MSFLKKNSIVNVIDKKDGRIYKCKVIKTSNDQVRVHFIGWNKSHDEWIARNDPRITVNPSNVAIRARSMEPFPSGAIGDRTSAEVEIDNLHERLFSSQPDHSLVQKQQVSGHITNKRGRDPNSTPRDEAPAKSRRTFFHIQGQPILHDEASSPVPRMVDADMEQPGAGAGSVTLSAPSSLPLRSHDASVTTADPGLGDGGAGTGDPGSTGSCGLCHLPVDRMMVRCNSCRLVFHSDPLCLGVNRGAALALVADVDGALTYKCCSCRFASSIDRVGLTQLLNMMGQAVKAIRTDRRSHVGVNDGGVSRGEQVERQAILAQVRELREREKRKDSVVIRGFSNINEDTLVNNINTICDLLHIQPVVLSEIVRIGESNMYRARIADSDSRTALLARCHQLRPTEEFRNVYINRDLTYQQRQDLRAKRRGALSESAAQPGTGANNIPVSRRISTSLASDGSVGRLQSVIARNHPGLVTDVNLPPTLVSGSQTNSTNCVPHSSSYTPQVRGRGRGRPRGSSVRGRGLGRGQVSGSVRGVAQGLGPSSDVSRAVGSLNRPGSSGSSQNGRSNDSSSNTGPGAASSRGFRSYSAVASSLPSARSYPSGSNPTTFHDHSSRPSTSDGRYHDDLPRWDYGSWSQGDSDVHIRDIPHMRRNLNC